MTWIPYLINHYSDRIEQSSSGKHCIYVIFGNNAKDGLSETFLHKELRKLNSMIPAVLCPNAIVTPWIYFMANGEKEIYDFDFRILLFLLNELQWKLFVTESMNEKIILYLDFCHIKIKFVEAYSFSIDNMLLCTP